MNENIIGRTLEIDDNVTQKLGIISIALFQEPTMQPALYVTYSDCVDVIKGKENILAFENMCKRIPKSPGINETGKIAHKIATEKGFWPASYNVGEKLMLITSELGEAMEAHRKGKFTNNIETFEETLAHLLEVNKDKPELHATIFKDMFVDCIKDTFEDEMADAVIRMFDLATKLGIDLEWHIKQKTRYNSGREYLHGKKY